MGWSETPSIAPPARAAMGMSIEGETAAGDYASRLCLSCGLCCDGGLFAYVELGEKDRARLSSAGFAAPERLTHPCCHFANGPCAVYDVRPRICRAYRCENLKAADEGAIDFETAHARVEQAVALRAKMDAAAPSGLSAREVASQWAEGGPGRAPERSVAMLAYVAYWTFAERYFLGDNIDRRVNRVALNPQSGSDRPTASPSG